MGKDETTARAVLAALDMAPAGLSPLGSGLASEAWLVHADGPALALRIATDPSDPPDTYRTEHALMARLAGLGARVPVPMSGNWQLDGWRLAPFSLTSFLPGVPLQANASEWAAGPLATFLRLLHGIPVTGAGRLVEIEGQLRGESEDMEGGLVAAFYGYPLWPFGTARLEVHPALALRPELVALVAGQAAAIRQAALEGPGVIVHSDLHEENILQDGHQLGFIDFGEAFIGSPAWEFAAMAYFGGWSLADRTLTAYLADRRDEPAWRASTAALAICFGLHRWEQDGRLAVDDTDHNETFLRQAVARLS